MHLDAGAQAAILKIYQQTGKLKKPHELRKLTEREKDWAVQALDEYMQDRAHPVRAMHAPFHYGRMIFWLSLFYYGTVVLWMAALLNISRESGKSVNWSAALLWILFAAILNLGLTAYGIYLESLSFKRSLSNGQRLIAAVAIIVLVIAILGNVIAPYSGSADSTSPSSQLFLRR